MRKLLLFIILGSPKVFATWKKGGKQFGKHLCPELSALNEVYFSASCT
jgi:hypothetical protein